ncbi:cyclic GMP-AMP synthase isoform X2 [Eublepharis macularius]|uniref:Cyclic GMP-AMP synthase isoform X2 n=1 Tax=Eublepharis macularius TaxID=481883 RepID=A0AA97K674_EUBMA|nr:cyclic GMP-AMP synthase isoform X2 [Eublepharis macularius]
MEQRAAGRPKGASKAAAAQPAVTDAPAQPASGPKGRGRRQDSGETQTQRPVKAKAPLSKERSGSREAGEEGAPRGRKASPKKGALKTEECGPAGGSNNPPGVKGASQKKRERPLQAKKVEDAPGAVSREKNHIPEEEEAARERKEASCRGKRAPPKERARKAKEPDPGAAEVVPRARFAARKSPLREVLQRLVLRKGEIGHASKQVNLIIKPDEFDIMLKIPDVRVELESYNDGDYTGAYYFVKLKRNPHLQQLNDFIDHQQHLSASRILSSLKSIITKELKTINGMNVTVVRKKPGSPAVTLQIGEPPSQISIDIILALETCDKTLPDGQEIVINVGQWLGKKEKKELCKERLYLVPKNAKAGKHFIDTWRLSFSHIEKAIIQSHGQAKMCCEGNGRKCCRRECLKLLKYLLEQLKTKHQNGNQFAKFCSYHAKTAFFHTCNRWTSDEDWLETNLEECFERLLDYFLDCLKKVELQHFFIPTCNLFCGDLKCSILAKIIENERANEFPIFKETI